MTWIHCSVCLVLTTVAVSEAERRLASLVAEAIERAGLKQEYVAAVAGIPRTKLSEQLNGRLPFTSLYRLLSNPVLRDETDFRLELLELFARSVDRAVVSRDLGHIVSRLDELVGRPKAAKMTLPAADERAVS